MKRNLLCSPELTARDLANISILRQLEPVVKRSTDPAVHYLFDVLVNRVNINIDGEDLQFAFRDANTNTEFSRMADGTYTMYDIPTTQEGYAFWRNTGITSFNSGVLAVYLGPVRTRIYLQTDGAIANYNPFGGGTYGTVTVSGLSQASIDYLLESGKLYHPPPGTIPDEYFVQSPNKVDFWINSNIG
jgi:hypothetical protein